MCCLKPIDEALFAIPNHSNGLLYAKEKSGHKTFKTNAECIIAGNNHLNLLD